MQAENIQETMTKDRPRSVRDLFLKEVAVLDRTVNTFMRKKLNKMKTHKWNKTIEELEEEKVAEKSSAESKMESAVKDFEG